MKKYELTDETIEFEGRKLYRIKALKDIPSIGVKAGDLGGFVESEYNLSQERDCWIFDDAKAKDKSYVCDNSCMYGNSSMRDYSSMCDNSSMRGYSSMEDNSCLIKNGRLHKGTSLFGDLVLDRPIKTFEFNNWDCFIAKNKEGKLVLKAGCKVLPLSKK